MTNFTSDVKRDLLRITPQKRCCRLALLRGFFDTGGCRLWKGEESEISFTSEKEEVAEYILALAEETFGANMTVTKAMRDPKHGRNKLTFSYTGARAGEIADELVSGAALAERECCIPAYLKGAFLGGGSCTLPHGGAKTGYHLEFVLQPQADPDAFLELFEKIQLIGNVIRRGEKHVVYLKSREGISDFLFSVGANAALRRLEDVSAAREESNNSNRVSNCYAGNADKAVTASATQALAIRRLKERGGLSLLPPPLLRLANDRLENPTFSLAELAEAEGVSKSCLNHRMRKLMTICDKTEEEV